MASTATAYVPPDPLDHQRLVQTIAKGFVGCGLDFPDLFQEGQIGLLLACRRFNPDQGFQFSTFAHGYIAGYILRAIHKASWPVRVPQHAKQETRARVSRRPSGLDETTIAAYVSEKRQAKSDDPVDPERIRNKLLVLSEREQAAVKMRFGIDQDGPMLMREIGAAMGVTGERAKQIVNRGMERLRQEFGVERIDQSIA